jgi:hypothetical protein
MGFIWNLRLAAAQTLNLWPFAGGEEAAASRKKGKVALTEKRASPQISGQARDYVSYLLQLQP